MPLDVSHAGQAQARSHLRRGVRQTLIYYWITRRKATMGSCLHDDD